MKRRTSSYFVVLVALLIGSAVATRIAPRFAGEPIVAAAAAQEKGGQEGFGPYEPVQNWPPWLPPQGFTWGANGALVAESPDKIWVAQRGELSLPANAKPGTFYGLLNRRASGFYAGEEGAVLKWEHVIFAVDRNGKMVESWPQHDKMFSVKPGRGPHTMRMNPYDPEKHLWVVDDGMSQIFEFSHDGKLLRTMGEPGVAANDGTHFGGPTDIDWLRDGTFFVSDGYINSRIAKFDKTGKFIMQWGSKGTGPGQFNNPHSVAIGPDGRVYVADRGNGRMQVFDQNGKLLDTWEGFRQPQTLLITGQNLWVSDIGTSRILKYDLNGKYLYGWGVTGTRPGNLAGAGAIAVDQENNFYVAELWNGRIQKFKPKPNADQAKLVLRSKVGSGVR